MIGTSLLEELVQATALTHRVKGFGHVGLLLLAAPESGKTTITTAAHAKHVQPVAVFSGRSIVREMHDNPACEFFLFNDLTAIRAMSAQAVALCIVLLNQITQGERGKVGFAGKDTEQIDRMMGVIGCLPFTTFVDHRSKWQHLGFISRMIPFAYAYPDALVAEIKDHVDAGTHVPTTRPRQRLPRPPRHPLTVTMTADLTRRVRSLADIKSRALGQLGIRLLKNYHCLIRAHALLAHRRHVTAADLDFLKAVDAFVSVTQCRPLTHNGHMIP